MAENTFQQEVERMCAEFRMKERVDRIAQLTEEELIDALRAQEVRVICVTTDEKEFEQHRQSCIRVVCPWNGKVGIVEIPAEWDIELGTSFTSAYQGYFGRSTRIAYV